MSSCKFRKIAPDVKLGKNIKIQDFVNLYGCAIGDNTKIGTFVEVQKGAKIGKNCKISSHSFICEGVTIGDRVFVGHHVVFINDKYPRSCTTQNKLKGDKDWKVIPILVKSDASIGSNSTILCGVTIGKGAMVGAGSVVVKNVPPFTVVCGNPAKILRKVTSKDL